MGWLDLATRKEKEKEEGDRGEVAFDGFSSLRQWPDLVVICELDSWCSLARDLVGMKMRERSTRLVSMRESEIGMISLGDCSTVRLL